MSHIGGINSQFCQRTGNQHFCFLRCKGSQTKHVTPVPPGTVIAVRLSITRKDESNPRQISIVAMSLDIRPYSEAEALFLTSNEILQLTFDENIRFVENNQQTQ